MLMSLHNLAKKVQGTGRGQDSMLVHMSPREVQGLQALAKVKGGQLTTNPKTGLPEAGFLEDILPMVAAGAAIYFTAGAAAPMLVGAGMGATSAGILAGAGAGALIGGGTAAIQGGDIGQAALMGGATGAIGGGISAGLGGGATVPTGTEGVSAAAANAPVAQATQVGTQAINVNPATGMVVDPLAAAPVPQAPAPVPQAAAPLQAPVQAPVAPQGQGLTVDQMIAGSGRPEMSGTINSFDPYAKIAGENLAFPPTQAASTSTTDLGKWWDSQSKWEKAGYASLGAGLTAGMAGQANAQVPTDDTSDDGNYLARISPNFQGQAPIQPNPYYQAQYPTYTKKPKYVAQGGLMSLAGGGPVERMTQNMLGGQGNMYPQSQQEHTNFATPTQMPASAEVIRSDYGAKTDPYTGVMLAGGGLADLGGYSDGGRLLKGPGDGMSDHIPAQIGSKQPARLADGEFVVPADVVSHIGNGSTDAGAKRLYAMMDKVRTARTGKKKQAPEVNTSKYLPA
jgi:hypothetical protein